MTQIIGTILVLLPFVALFVAVWVFDGLRAAVESFVAVVVIMSCVAACAYLLAIS